MLIGQAHWIRGGGPARRSALLVASLCVLGVLLALWGHGGRSPRDGGSNGAVPLEPTERDVNGKEAARFMPGQSHSGRAAVQSGAQGDVSGVLGAHRITGRVEDGAGNGLPGAEVGILGGCDADLAGVRSWTNQDGIFSISVDDALLEPMRDEDLPIVLGARKVGYEAVEQRLEPEVLGSDTTSVRFMLSPCPSLGGTVVDMALDAVCGASVRIVSAEGRTVSRGTTDFSGAFLISLSRPGNLYLSAARSGVGATKLKLPPDAGIDSLNLGVVTLQGDGKLRGRLVLPSGESAVGGSIAFHRVGPGPNDLAFGNSDGIARADSEGVFEVLGVQQGEYALSSVHGGKITPDTARTGQPEQLHVLGVHLVSIAVLDPLGNKLSTGVPLAWRFFPSDESGGSEQGGVLSSASEDSLYRLWLESPGELVLDVFGEHEVNKRVVVGEGSYVHYYEVRLGPGSDAVSSTGRLMLSFADTHCFGTPFRLLLKEESGRAVSLSGEAGPFLVFEDVPVGTYRGSFVTGALSQSLWRLEDIDVTISAGGSRNCDVQVARSAALFVRVEGEAEKQFEVSLASADGVTILGLSALLQDSDRIVSSAFLPANTIARLLVGQNDPYPGEYILSIVESGSADLVARERIVLQAGKATSLHF